MSATLTFLGAAGTVTGSRHFLESGQTRLLLDCGLFQGLKELRLRNWAPSPVPATSIAGVLLSHAHIDHSGALPRLGREGFRGPIYCTGGTAELLGIMLPDAAHLQEEEAEFANRHRTSKHEPALPLFTTADADRVLTQVRPVGFNESFSPAAGVSARFINSGHILGAAFIEVSIDGRTLVFTGDIGRYGVPIMRDPDPVAAADVLLLESTYGNRLHPPDDHHDMLAAAVERAVAQKAWLLVPAFAIGRTQEILYDLRGLEDVARIHSLPVYLDSPMGDKATKRLNDTDGPGILIAGSGMATGGRILHHFVRRLSDVRTTVLFVGYQAAGTRGRLLRDGAQRLRIFGEDVPVRAAIMSTDALSAHADQAEILRWLRGFKRAPTMTYCVHGEPAAAAALRDAIERQLGWRCAVAADRQRIEL